MSADYTNDSRVDEGERIIEVGNDRRGTVRISMAKSSPMAFIIAAWNYPAETDIEVGISSEEALAIGEWLCRRAVSTFSSAAP